jgi:dicarboxylate/amino acid:cation (Na+ or H+) symporter, DAACS family
MSGMAEKSKRSEDAFEREVTTDLKDVTPDKPRGMPLHRRILLGLVIGVVAGLLVNAFFPKDMLNGQSSQIEWFIKNVTEPIGQIFLRLLLMSVVPLVFSSLVVGVAGIGDIRRLGRIGLKTFVYTIIISAISVVIGIGAVNLIQPGNRLDPGTEQALQERYQKDASKHLEDAKKVKATDSAFMTVVKTLIPSNPIASAASETPNMLHLMVFSVILGIATTLVRPDITVAFVGAMDGLFNVSAKIIDLIMKTAPLAVACLLFNNVARFGLDLLQALGWFFITVIAGLAIHMFVVYSISISTLSKISPIEFFRRIKTVMLTAFSTSSSNATLPTALRVSEENLGVPREINSFVLTIGATANQNGTALYEGVTVLFLAQLSGLDLSLSMQILVALMAILGGVGTAGIPSGSLPFIVVILAQVGVNPALIAIILGLDRILDMCRTTLNVVGDLTAATYVARSEGYELLKTGQPVPAQAV